MNILNICTNPEILSVIRIVKLILNIIRIVVPIILIVSLSIRYVSVITSQDNDALNKVNKSIIPNAIAAICIFLMPTFVNIVTKMVSSDNNDYYECIKNATPEIINELIVDDIEKYVDTVRKTLNKSDYKNALDKIKKVDNDSKKESLLKELENLEYYVNLKYEINELDSKKDKDKLKEISKKVDEIKDESIKKILTELLESKSINKSIDVEPGSYFKTFTASAGSMEYYIFIPEEVTSQMPLIVYLHGDGSVYNVKNLENGEMAKFVNNTYGNNFPFIYIQPHTKIASWTDGNIPTTLKSLIDSVVDEYNCDSSKIALSGGSRGAMGAWYMANKYGNYFSSFMPISGTGNIDGNNFKDLPTWAFSSTDSSDLWNFSNMQANVNKINSSGGHATFTSKSGYNHSTILSGVFNKTTFEWLISQ